MAGALRVLALAAALLLGGCEGGGSFVLTDSSGDGPPAGITLPLAETFRAPGLYDLRELAVDGRGEDLLIAVGLGRPLTDSARGGAELVSVLVLVDTRSGGSPQVPGAPALSFARGAWNVAVRMDPWGVTVRDAAGTVLATGQAGVVQDRLIAKVSAELITTRPAAAGWSVLVFASDVFSPQGVRPLQASPGVWTLGGELPSPVLDALEAPGAPGGSALTSGTISFVRPARLRPEAFLWLTAVGLLIFGGAIIWDLWRAGRGSRGPKKWPPDRVARLGPPNRGPRPSRKAADDAGG